MFITFEGMDGSGKSTQVRLLDRWLRDSGHPTLLLRDPGGTAIGEQIRDIVLRRSNAGMHAVTEVLLYAASRSQLVQERIQPALAEGTIVISDRFYDSTTAYQGSGRKLPKELIDRLNSIGSHNTVPDISIFLDLDIQEGMKRLDKTRQRDRMENEDHSFREKVREAFLEISRTDKERFITIDASGSPEEIHQEIRKIISDRLRK